MGQAGRRTLRTRCAACGKTAAEARLRKVSGAWTLAYAGIVAGTGPDGAPVSSRRAKAVLKAFKGARRFESFAAAELHDHGGVCIQCRKPYCWTHWGQPIGAGGRCPQGHFQSLDPHWTPDLSAEDA
jgi:hypothetical protein